ncbi:DUF4190 domain-containing protein [Microbacterium sp. NPDC028030]|uniref:DUF4190 domain-containing protein n=1 Tax=Microbacterium sp. NPDC028030 TaxID=3155124 RepID=UPI0033D5C8CA
MTNPPTPDSPNPESRIPDMPPPPPSAAPTPPPASTPYENTAPDGIAGHPPAGTTGYAQPQPSPPGRVLSIVGLVLAFVAAPVGLILSIVAAVKLGRAGQPKGLAIAGIIVGALLTILGIIGIILFVTVIAGLVGMCAELGPGVWDVDGITYRCG